MEFNNCKKTTCHMTGLLTDDANNSYSLADSERLTISSTEISSRTYGNELIGSLRTLQQSDELCDFTIRCEHKHIRVHKVLLAATSGFFCAMLRVPMKEMKEDSVELHSVKPAAIQAIIDFIYSAKITLSLDTLIDIVEAANHLQVQSAIDVCSDYIISKLNFNNAEFLVHNIADTYCLTRVLDFYHCKILREFEEFSSTQLYFELSADQLKIYLNSSSLTVKSEIRLLDMIDYWIAHDPVSRVQQCASLISCIRFGLMSKAELNEAAAHRILQTTATVGLSSTATTIAEALTAGVLAGRNYHSQASIGYPPLLPVVGGVAKLEDSLPVCRQYATIRSTLSSLVLIHTGSSSRQFDIIAYNQLNASFYRLAIDQITCRDSRTVVVDNFVFVLRVVDAGGGTLVSSLLRFDPRHLSITVLPSCRRLRLDPAVVALTMSDGGKVYVFGGSVDVPDGQSGQMILDSVEVYDVMSNRWDVGPSLPIPTHSHAACALPDGRVLISGGVTGPQGLVTSAVYMYNTVTGQYRECAALTCARRLHEMLWVGEGVYAVGGINAQHTFHNAQTLVPLERFDPLTEQWTVLRCGSGTLNPGGTLAGRSVGHFVVVDGEMLSLGREHHLATEEDIWRYNNEDKQWEKWGKVPARWSLATSVGVTLSLNFSDDKIMKRIIDKR